MYVQGRDRAVANNSFILTNVTWTRDGSTIEMDGEGYEMMQMVTERQSYSRYRNTLYSSRMLPSLPGTIVFALYISSLFFIQLSPMYI